MVGSGRGHQQCGTLDGLDAILCLLPPVALPRLQVFTRPAKQSLSLDFFSILGGAVFSIFGALQPERYAEFLFERKC